MRHLYLAPALLLAVVTMVSAADVSVTEELVAKVNGDIITSSDLAEDRASIEVELRKKGLSGAALDRAVNDEMPNALRLRVDNFLLMQKAKDLNVKVDQDLNRELANYMRTTNTSDPEEFQKLVVKETGRPYEDFKDKIKESLLINAVVSDEIRRKITIPKEEMLVFYEGHKAEFQRQERVFLREIVVAIDAKKTPEEVAAAEAKAKSLATRGQRGETFPLMAQNNSDAITKDQGGLLEPFAKGVLAPELESQVWDKPAGTVTDPIKLANNSGWIILKVEDHQRAGQAAFDEVESEIANRMYAERLEPAYRAYLTKLRQEAFLQIKASYADSGASPNKDTTWGEFRGIQPQTTTRAEVLSNPTMKRLLGMFPIPGTEKTGASSSR